MSTERTHPTDTTLIMANDRELSTPRREAVNDHLKVCDECATRLSALEAAAAESARLCRDDTIGDGLETSVLRARVQQRMFELRNEWDRSLLFRVRRMVGSVPRFALVGITVTLLALMVRFAAPGQIGVLPASLRAESLPIAQLTPGATANVRVADLCSGSAPSPRIVSLAVREQVLKEYQMEYVPATEYELDYLITPELGGVGDARNLWPERYAPGPWNAHVKDDLERLLSRLVCDGSIDLSVAQQEIATNWIEAYKRHFGTDRPIPRQAGIEDDDDAIRFESPATIPRAAPAMGSFAPLRISLSARLAADEVFEVSLARRVAWR